MNNYAYEKFFFSTAMQKTIDKWGERCRIDKKYHTEKIGEDIMKEIQYHVTCNFIKKSDRKLLVTRSVVFVPCNPLGVFSEV